MKRKILMIIFTFCMILISGCSIAKDNMEGIKIYTTIYPIKYLIESLYGTNSSIYSIYPSGVDPNNFELSDKKIEEYSKTDLFVFNSLDRDRDLVVSMINKNKKLKVIDVSLDVSLSKTYSGKLEELWLNPYIYLMMAQNTKNGLLEYISNPYLVTNNDNTGVDDKYEELKYNLSRLDADMKETISLAKYKTIVTDNDLFKFLEKYGLRVISLEETEDLSENSINETKKLINNGQIKYIFSANSETNNTCKNIIDNYDVELITLNTMNSIDGGIENSNENYLTVMNNNLELLNKELYK